MRAGLLCVVLASCVGDQAQDDAPPREMTVMDMIRPTTQLACAYYSTRIGLDCFRVGLTPGSPPRDDQSGTCWDISRECRDVLDMEARHQIPDEVAMCWGLYNGNLDDCPDVIEEEDMLARFAACGFPGWTGPIPITYDLWVTRTDAFRAYLEAHCPSE